MWRIRQFYRNFIRKQYLKIYGISREEMFFKKIQSQSFKSEEDFFKWLNDSQMGQRILYRIRR